MPGLRAVWNSKAETGRAGGCLDIHAYLGGELVIEECFAGSGGLDRDDFGVAMANFAINSLHVLLTGLYGVVDPEQVVVERWLVGGKSYQAYVGNFGQRASAGVEPKVPDGLSARSRPPSGLNRSAETRIGSEHSSPISTAE